MVILGRHAHICTQKKVISLEFNEFRIPPTFHIPLFFTLEEVGCLLLLLLSLLLLVHYWKLSSSIIHYQVLGTCHLPAATYYTFSCCPGSYVYATRAFAWTSPESVIVQSVGG